MITRFASSLLAGLWALRAILRAQRRPPTRRLITADEIECDYIRAIHIEAGSIERDRSAE